jgi:hypothetical protein
MFETLEPRRLMAAPDVLDQADWYGPHDTRPGIATALQEKAGKGHGYGKGGKPAPEPEPPLPPPPPAGEVPPAPPPVFGGPLVITAGGTYRGSYESLDPATPAIRIQTTQPVTIEGAYLRGKGDLIRSDTAGANITIRRTMGWGANPDVAGKAPGRFFYAFNFGSVRLEDNYLEDTTGIVLNGNQAGGAVTVLGNFARNINGRLSDGQGGWLGGGQHKRAQFINLDKVQNVAGVEIAWNQVHNEPGRSRVEDNINLYQSSGTPSSPIRIHDNLIRGAYNADPASDPSYAGGGILLGDGHDGSAYAEAYRNVVISTTNYGIAISGGHDQRIYDNIVLSSGLLPDGRRIAAQNVGIYIWDYHDAGAAFHSNSGSGNLVGWMRGTSRNDWWVPDASSWSGNTRWSGTPTLAQEQEQVDAWMVRPRP